jgi:hypothetical protein
VGVQYFDPVLRRSPLMAPLFGLSGAGKSYGLLIRNDGFTPASLTPNEALIGDRPYASLLFLGHTIVSKDPERGLTLTAELDTGIIGQAAGGKSQQVAIHSAIRGNQIPLGWDNQIRNDAVLDYYLRLEKTVAASKAADLGVYGEATAGTLYDNVDAGVMGRVGNVGVSGKARYYLFGRAEDKLVGYDATLQGGLLNRGSPYALTTEEVRRSVLRADAGFAADFGRWIVEADRTYLSREFSTGLSHEWVEISVSRRF